jgi:hypothetical protein
MFYYLYEIKNNLNGKIYVGVHKTESLDDGYMGSGRIICSAIAKNGIANFSKVILENFDTSESMYAREKEIVTDEFLMRKDTYNLRRGGTGGFDYINKTVDFINRNTKASRNGNIEDKRSITVKKLWQDGIYSNRPINFIGSVEGTKVWTGNHHTDETKFIIGMKNSIHQSGEKNSQFGTMWITDEVSNIKIKKDSLIPEGWRKGRKIK